MADVKVTKLTDVGLLRAACAATMHGQGGESKASLRAMYETEHSPIRTQLFWIELHGIPSFVSTHLVRHHVGVDHFVSTNRDDRGGEGDEGRMTPVSHCMLVNAQALINMSRKRLCGKAHKLARDVMQQVKDCVAEADPDLAIFMVPECEYRGGVCHERTSCGRCPKQCVMECPAPTKVPTVLAKVRAGCTMMPHAMRKVWKSLNVKTLRSLIIR